MKILRLINIILILFFLILTIICILEINSYINDPKPYHEIGSFNYYNDTLITASVFLSGCIISLLNYFLNNKVLKILYTITIVMFVLTALWDLKSFIDSGFDH